MLRAFLALCCIAVFAGVAQAADERSGFDPDYEALVLVNLSVPAQVETAARLHTASIRAHAGPHPLPARAEFTILDAGELAGRSLRWASLALEPTVLDSLVIRWEQFEVRVDGAWTRPAPEGHATVVPLARRVTAGEVVVLNLRWDPDAQSAGADTWWPRFSVDELVEPPLGARLYVSEESTGVVAVHERLEGRLVRALATGGQPRDLAWDRLRQRLYVSVAGRDELVVFDPAGRETTRRIPLSFGADPTRVLLTTDRRYLAVLAPGRDMVFLFSASSLQELAKISVGQEPVALVEDLRSGRIYVSCRTAGRIDVIDPSQARIVSSFGSLDSPTELVRLESGLIAVGQRLGRRVDLLDPNTGAIQRSIEACGPADGLVEVSRVGRLFVLSNACGELTVLRPELDLELESVTLPGRAGLPTLGPRAAELYLPLPGSARVMVIAVDRTSEHRFLDTGPGPWRVIAP